MNAESAQSKFLSSHRLALRPDPLLTVSQWADAYRRLTTNESGEPGEWRTPRTAYLGEPMNRAGVMDHVTREVTFKFGSQLGKTEATNNALGYWIDCAPGPAMFVQPTLEMLKEWSRNRLDKMIEGTPRLRDRVTEKKSRDSANTLTQKEFPGGNIVCRTAGSASGLQSAPRRYAVGDEIDKWPLDVDGAGSPIANIRQRTAAFSNSKCIWTSTPSLHGISVIDELFDAGDQRHYWVPCPRCGRYELLEWRDFVWTAIGREPQDCAWQCPDCGELAEQHEIHAMNERGVWVPHVDSDYHVADDDTIETGYEHKSYYLPGWHSPWPKSSWGAIAQEFVAAGGDPTKRTAWTNLREGKSYNPDAGERPDDETLARRVEPIDAIPSRAKLLTAAVDIQGNRWEMAVVAWGPGEESWIVDYVRHFGDPDADDFWDILDGALRVRYPHASGKVLPIMCACIDSGFKSDRVYAFCSNKQKRRIFAIKGLPSQRYHAPIWPRRPSRAAKRKWSYVDRYDVNVNEAKAVVYARLRLTAKVAEDLPDGAHAGEVSAAGFVHFNRDVCDGEFFQQLTAEVRVQRMKAGQVWYEFTKTRDRNEALDVVAYNVAALRALQSMRVILGHHESDADREPEQAAKPPQAPVEHKRATRPQPQRKPPVSRRGGWGQSRKW